MRPAMDPDHDRHSRLPVRNLSRRPGRGIDVQGKAVFASHRGARRLDIELRAREAKLQSLTHAIPGFRFLRRTPAKRTHRRTGKGNPTPDVRSVLTPEADRGALLCLSQRIRQECRDRLRPPTPEHGQARKQTDHGKRPMPSRKRVLPRITSTLCLSHRALPLKKSSLSYATKPGSGDHCKPEESEFSRNRMRPHPSPQER